MNHRGITERREKIPLDSPRDGRRPPRRRDRRLRDRRRNDEAIRSLAREEKTTLFAALLAIYQRSSNLERQDDICVGVPTAGRVHPLTEGLVGLFVNTLVMRSSASGDPTFREFSAGPARRCSRLTSRGVPFERVVADLRPDRAFGRTPFAGAVFAFQNLPGAAFVFPARGVAVRHRGGGPRNSTSPRGPGDGRAVLGSLEIPQRSVSTPRPLAVHRVVDPLRGRGRGDPGCRISAPRSWPTTSARRW